MLTFIHLGFKTFTKGLLLLVISHVTLRAPHRLETAHYLSGNCSSLALVCSLYVSLLLMSLLLFCWCTITFMLELNHIKLRFFFPSPNCGILRSRNIPG